MRLTRFREVENFVLPYFSYRLSPECSILKHTMDIKENQTKCSEIVDSISRKSLYLRTLYIQLLSTKNAAVEHRDDMAYNCTDENFT